MSGPYGYGYSYGYGRHPRRPRHGSLPPQDDYPATAHDPSTNSRVPPLGGGGGGASTAGRPSYARGGGDDDEDSQLPVLGANESGTDFGNRLWEYYDGMRERGERRDLFYDANGQQRFGDDRWNSIFADYRERRERQLQGGAVAPVVEGGGWFRTATRRAGDDSQQQRQQRPRTDDGGLGRGSGEQQGRMRDEEGGIAGRIRRGGERGGRGYADRFDPFDRLGGGEREMTPDEFRADALERIRASRRREQEERFYGGSY